MKKLLKCIGQNLILKYDCEYNGYKYNILESNRKNIILK